MAGLDKSASAIESDDSDHMESITRFARKSHGSVKTRTLSDMEVKLAKTKRRIDQVAMEFTMTMEYLSEIEDKVRSIEEFHEEQQNAHREEMERLKASAAEARNETVRWQSDDIDVMSELSKLQPEEGLEEFRKETEYLENKYEVLHRDLVLQSEELLHLQSTNLELAKRIQELERVIHNKHENTRLSHRMLAFGKGPKREVIEELDPTKRVVEK